MSPPPETPLIIYFSSVSENTHRFVEKLHLPAARIPLRRSDGELTATGPYVLIVPTYGGGDADGAVPRQVTKFLAHKPNAFFLRGVISSGNTNFGTAFCTAGPQITRAFNVPELYRFELLGTPRDVAIVRSGITRFLQQ